jgi:hypothetical protein
MGPNPRKSQCPCGKTFSIPKQEEIPEARPVSVNLAPKVTPAVPVATPVAVDPIWSTPAVPAASNHAPIVPYAGTLTPAVSAEPKSSQSRSFNDSPNDVLTSTYMAQAEEDSYRHSHRSEQGYFDGTLLSGVLMMVGSVVWLLVGLQFDLLFYYPLFLFVVGFITCIKALVD